MADAAAELYAMTTAYEALKDLDEDQLSRALSWLTDALGVQLGATALSQRSTEAVAPAVGGQVMPTSAGDVEFAGGSVGLSPKEFIREKKPKSGAERIACLAYYLAEYRSTPHFKVPEIVALNTEAAQAKIGNPSRDLDNADRGSGYLAAAGSGNKQLSARGEALVLALPDRDAVTQALAEHPIRRRVKKAPAKKSPARKPTTKEAPKKSSRKSLPKP